MAGIVDVAAYILSEYGPMTTMKLQKLAFYSQAESLSRHGRPLFDEDFQAWRGGPVCSPLYAQHRGKFLIRDGELNGDIGVLNDSERAIVDSVCQSLSNLTGNQLSARTHRESPWADARKGLSSTASGNVIISKSSITRYYRNNPVIPGIR